MALKFVPMDENQFREWRAVSEQEYCESLIKTGFITKKAAANKAKKDGEIIKQGLATPDHFFYNVVREDGTCVGHFWYAFREIDEAKVAFIYDIAMKTEFRGQGYGKATMALFEADVKAKGYKRLGLNVFGYNVPARKLYQQMGYQEISVYMGKDL
jgi:ribosomal protein S18 acetylase RimI-like enzyme